MNTKNMTKAQMADLLAELLAERDAKPATKAPRVAKAPRDNAKPRVVNLAKACERGIRVNGERVVGTTFAVWHIDGDAKNRDSKRASVATDSFLAITRDGLADADRDALVKAWVALKPKARAKVETVAFKDAWLVRVAK